MWLQYKKRLRELQRNYKKGLDEAVIQSIEHVKSVKGNRATSAAGVG